jgi:hypothetical protein
LSFQIASGRIGEKWDSAQGKRDRLGSAAIKTALV